MKERIIITGYSGSLAKITRKLLQDDYEIIGLTSNKKKVNNKDHEPFPKEGVVPRSHVDPLERAEWMAKEPLPAYITEYKNLLWHKY